MKLSLIFANHSKKFQLTTESRLTETHEGKWSLHTGASMKTWVGDTKFAVFTSPTLMRVDTLAAELIGDTFDISAYTCGRK